MGPQSCRVCNSHPLPGLLTLSIEYLTPERLECKWHRQNLNKWEYKVLLWYLSGLGGQLTRQMGARCKSGEAHRFPTKGRGAERTQYATQASRLRDAPNTEQAECEPSTTPLFPCPAAPHKSGCALVRIYFADPRQVADNRSLCSRLSIGSEHFRTATITSIRSTPRNRQDQGLTNRTGPGILDYPYPSTIWQSRWKSTKFDQCGPKRGDTPAAWRISSFSPRLPSVVWRSDTRFRCTGRPRG